MNFRIHLKVCSLRDCCFSMKSSVVYIIRDKDIPGTIGYDATRDYENQIKKLDKEIKEAENRLKYL